MNKTMGVPSSKIKKFMGVPIHHNIGTIGAFISSWKTDNAGTSASNQITLPLRSDGTYNFSVEWGDGSGHWITSYNQAQVTHTYPSAGTYTVTIRGTINGWQFNNTGDKLKILTITQWGALRVGNAGSYFYGCSNLAGTVTDCLDTSGMTNMYSMFYGCTAFNQSVANFNTAAVTDMNRMFYGCTAFNQSVANFNTAAVTDMYSMFTNCTAFNQSVANFNTAAVTDMGRMFYGCTAFNQDLSGWDVTKVTTMATMLSGVTLSTANYDALLIAWSAEAVTSSVNFHAGSSKYTAGGDAATGRAHLIDPHLWTITDGGTA